MKSLGAFNVHMVFPPKQVIRFEGQLYDYRGRARDKQRRHIFEADNRLRVDFSDSEIMDLQHHGKIEILGQAEAESARLVAEGKKPLPNFDSASPADRSAARMMHKYIRRWESAGCPARTEGLAPLIAEVAKAERDPKPPSPRTLCRRLAAWVESGGDINSLLPTTSRCGNTSDRIDPGLKSQFRELIEKSLPG